LEWRPERPLGLAFLEKKDLKSLQILLLAKPSNPQVQAMKRGVLIDAL
jgi:hypothetical protein